MILKALAGVVAGCVAYWRIAAAFKWAEERLDQETRDRG